MVIDHQRSTRLDTDQEISKEILMTADENVVKACQECRTSSGVSLHVVHTHIEICLCDSLLKEGGLDLTKKKRVLRNIESSTL